METLDRVGERWLCSCQSCCTRTLPLTLSHSLTHALTGTPFLFGSQNYPDCWVTNVSSRAYIGNCKPINDIQGPRLNFSLFYGLCNPGDAAIRAGDGSWLLMGESAQEDELGGCSTFEGPAAVWDANVWSKRTGCWRLVPVADCATNFVRIEAAYSPGHFVRHACAAMWVHRPDQYSGSSGELLTDFCWRP